MTPTRLVAGLVVAFSVIAGVAVAEEQPVLNAAVEEAVEAGTLSGLHGVIVRMGDETLAEVFFSGEDERWGSPLGPRDHGPETLHDLRSVTKSIVGLLYGIALAEGKVPPPDAPLLAAFPDYSDLAEDPDRQKITIGHTLSMKMGTEWDENLPYTDPRNSEIAMELSEDRYRFALDRPMVSEPGEAWVYNGGAVALIAKVIADGTGMDLEDYAAEKLFAPLGIDKFEWVRGGDGEPSAASGLRLAADGLARIGTLILQDGTWDGRQIVPADWLAQAFTPRSKLRTVRYGYLWWLDGEEDPPAWVSGFGNGGQRLTVQPELDLVLVVFAGNYNHPDAWKMPVKIITDIVSPEITKRLGE